MKLLIKNGRMVNAEGKPEPVDIFIENGIITQIAKKIDMDIPQTLDVMGKIILPGLIDMDCNIFDPGNEYREDIVTASRAGAKGGFTTLTCSPDTKPAIDNKTVVNYVISKSKSMAKINILPYGSMTVGCQGGEMSDMGEMKCSGIIGLSDGGKSIECSNLLRNIFIYSKMLDLPVITTCEDSSLMDGGVVNRGFVSTRTGLQGIPKEAEEVAVSRDVILAKHTGARVHIGRISTEGSINIIRAAKAEGVKVTCATLPHYFTLSEESVSNYNTLAKVRPPLRGQRDIEAVKEAIADGTIDAISSGHMPNTIESKMIEFDKASFGISSLETTFFLSYTTLVKRGVLTLRELIEKISIAPATILGLEGKADIAVDNDADLIIFDPEAKQTINASEFISKAKFSPYDGQEVWGKVMYTVRGGEIVYVGE